MITFVCSLCRSMIKRSFNSAKFSGWLLSYVIKKLFSLLLECPRFFNNIYMGWVGGAKLCGASPSCTTNQPSTIQDRWARGLSSWNPNSHILLVPKTEQMVIIHYLKCRFFHRFHVIGHLKEWPNTSTWNTALKHDMTLSLRFCTAHWTHSVLNVSPAFPMSLEGP